jgi:3-hydroxyisobutyrate dehydrogenase
MGGAPSSVAWIGAGIMGSPMAGHLMAAGHPMTVHSRRRESAQTLLDAGARWAGTAREAAQGADVVFTMVGYPDDVRAVVLGDGGALAGMGPGSLLVEMTTSEPALAIEIAAAGGQVGVDVLDAPVSGGDVGARDGKLVVMVGGDEAAYARALPLLEIFSRKVTRHGGPGAGQHAKMANQIHIASGMVAMCETLLYASSAGLDVAATIETLQAGAAASWSMGTYGPRSLDGDFAPGFKIDHFVKDLGIALSAAREMKLSLPGLALAHQLYVACQAQDAGGDGTHALLRVLARLSGRTWGPS